MSRLEKATDPRSDGLIDDWKELRRYESSSIELSVSRLSMAVEFVAARPQGSRVLRSAPKVLSQEAPRDGRRANSSFVEASARDKPDV
jgi:hypothetical protein